MIAWQESLKIAKTDRYSFDLTDWLDGQTLTSATVTLANGFAAVDSQQTPTGDIYLFLSGSSVLDITGAASIGLANVEYASGAIVSSAREINISSEPELIPLENLLNLNDFVFFTTSGQVVERPA